MDMQKLNPAYYFLALGVVEEIAPAMVSYSIQLIEKELEYQSNKLDIVEDLGGVLRQLQDKNLIPLGML